MTKDRANRSKWKWTADKEQAALLLAQGKTWKEIEEQNGLSHSSVAMWVKHQEFQDRIAEHIESFVSDARKILQRAATNAARTVVQLNEWGLPGHSTRLAAAKDILDRVGLKPPDKQQVESTGDVTITVRYVKPNLD